MQSIDRFMRRHAMTFATICSACTIGLFLAPVAAQTQSAGASAAEANYADALRAKLDHGKRAPTGREISEDRPSGTAAIWFVLSRQGKVMKAGVEKSSGSIPLDAMASTLVRRAKLPSYPAGVFEGEDSHRFVVRYAFDRERVGRVMPGPEGLVVRP